MIKRSLYIFLLLCHNLLAQVNIVNNPSFEDTIACPNNFSQINYTTSWYSPTSGTPDYFNSCETLPINMGIPNNAFGFQQSKSGNGYCGIYVYGISPPGKEYIQSKLLDSLISGKRYCISFYVSLSNTSGIAINNIGALLSDTPISSGSIAPLPYLPQIVSGSTYFLKDTNQWMSIKGIFKANGGEKYITIGSFNSYSSTDTLQIQSGSSSYYYIDDVAVVECENLTIPNVITPNGDNQNDFFYISQLDEKSSLRIFNRWGNEIFATNNYLNDWEAKNVCAGTYYYILATPDNEIYKGFLEVIK